MIRHRTHKRDERGRLFRGLALTLARALEPSLVQAAAREVGPHSSYTLSYGYHRREWLRDSQTRVCHRGSTIGHLEWAIADRPVGGPLQASADTATATQRCPALRARPRAEPSPPDAHAEGHLWQVRGRPPDAACRGDGGEGAGRAAGGGGERAAGWVRD